MITYTLNQYGLRQKDMDYMIRLFESVPGVEKVMLFGSRSTGNFERGSDVDLAIVGETVASKEISRIHFMLEEESPTLLGFDVVHYDTIKKEALKKEIDTYGKVIFERIKNLNGQ